MSLNDLAVIDWDDDCSLLDYDDEKEVGEMFREIDDFRLAVPKKIKKEEIKPILGRHGFRVIPLAENWICGKEGCTDRSMGRVGSIHWPYCWTCHIGMFGLPE